MKKFMNSVDTVLSESLAGFASAHSDLLTLAPSGKFVSRKELKQGKVALISGGGSGHEPLHGALLATECWMRPVPVRFLRRPRLIR